MSGFRTVTSPVGADWRLERQLVRVRVRHPRWPGRRHFGPQTLNVLDPTGIGSDFDGWVGITVALFVFVIIGIPLLLFSVELLISALVALATLAISLVIAPRWRIRATNTSTGDIYEHEVTGRRSSEAALENLAAMIRSGKGPPLTSPPRARRPSIPPPI